MTGLFIIVVLLIIVALRTFPNSDKDATLFEEQKRQKEEEDIKKIHERQIANLMFSIMSILAKEGFRPKNQENAILFKYEGNTFVVYFDDRDPNFFCIEHCICSFDKKEEEDVLKIASKLNSNHKYSRIFITDDYFVYVRTAVSIIDHSNIHIEFWRGFNFILSIAHDFWEKTNYIKNISPN
jgi:hypothetical protein